jgi:tetratricopeptide (TPR) repeat protein
MSGITMRQRPLPRPLPLSRPLPLLPLLPLLLLPAILLFPAQALCAGDSPEELPPEAEALLKGETFSVEAFDRAARAVRLAGGSLDPLAAAARSDRSPPAQRVLVEVLWAEGRPVEALAEAETLQALLPADPEAAALCGRLAETGRNQGGAAEAAEWYRKALALQPDPTLRRDLTVRLALLDFDNDRAEEGLKRLEEVARLDRPGIAAAAARIAALYGHDAFAAEHAGPLLSESRRGLFLSTLQAASFQAEGKRFDAARESLRQAGAYSRSRRERRFLAWSEADLAAKAGTLTALLDQWNTEETLDHDRLKFFVESLESLGRSKDALGLLARPEARDSAAGEWVSLIFSLALDAGAVDEATGILRKKLAAEPDSLDVRLRFSRVLIDLGRVAEAEALWLDALALETWKAGRERIRLCRKIHDAGFPGLAREVLAAFHEEDRTPWGAWAGLELARLWREAGRQDEAMEIIAAVAAGPTTDRNILRAAGEALEKLGSEKKAVTLYKRILESTEGEDLQMRLAWLLARTGRGLEAVTVLRAVWERTGSASRRRQAENQLLELSAKEGVLGELADRLEVALDSGETTPREVALLVNLYTKVGDPDSAAEVLNEFGGRDGDRIASLETLARVYLDTGEMGEYEKVLHRLIDEDPSRAGEWWMQLAMSALERKKPDEAQEALRSLAALKEKDHAFRAGVLAFAGLHEEAVSEYRKALARNPEEVELWLLVGRELAALGRKEEAIHLYQFLADRPGEDDLFVVAVDGLLNLNAPASVLAWAARRVEERIVLQPTRLFLSRILVDLAETLGDRERARRVLTGMVPVAAEQRSAVLRELLEEARAERDGKRVVRFGRQLMAVGDLFPPEVYLAVGEALVKERAFSEAARVFARARDSQDFMAIQKRVARIYLENGKSDLALRILRSLIMQAPEDPGLLAEVAAAESIAGDPAAMATWDRTLKLLITRTPRSREGKSAAGGSYRNVNSLDMLWDQVVQGIATTSDREGLAGVMNRLAGITGDELAAAGDGFNLDMMPRLARLLDMVVRLSISTGRAERARELCLAVVSVGNESSKKWISARIHTFLGAGWARTATLLLDAMGDEASSVHRWQAQWIGAGAPPEGEAPDVMAGIDRATWHYIFSGSAAAGKALEEDLAKTSPWERARSLSALAPLRLLLGEREGFFDEIRNALTARPDDSKEKTARPVRFFEMQRILARSWRIFTPAERGEVLELLFHISVSADEDAGWRGLYLHGLLASGAAPREGLDLHGLMLELGEKHRNVDDLALFLLLADRDRRAEVIESFAGNLKTSSLARFLALAPRRLAHDLDEASCVCLCRLYRTCTELKRLAGSFARSSNPALPILDGVQELRFLDVLIEKRPDDAYLVAAKAKALARTGRIDEALEAVRSLVVGEGEGGVSSFILEETFRSVFGAAGGETVESILRAAAEEGSSEAVRTLASRMSDAGRLEEALACLDEWTGRHGEELRMFQQRMRLLRSLGRHGRAARETNTFYRDKQDLQSYHRINWVAQLREQGKFRESLRTIAAFTQPSSAGIDYGALRRVRSCMELPPSEERDRLVAEDLRKVFLPADENGLRIMGFQFRNLPPAAMISLAEEGENPAEPTPFMRAAALPGALPEFERFMTLLPSTMNRSVTSWEYYAAVAWAYHALERDAELLDRVERSFACEPADRTALLLANMAASWTPEARRAGWVRRGLALALVTAPKDAGLSLFWADRLMAAGEEEAAARFVGYVLLSGGFSNGYRSRQALRQVVGFQERPDIPRELLGSVLQTQLPLAPPRVFGQPSTSFTDTSLLETWVRCGLGADIVSFGGSFIEDVKNMEEIPAGVRLRLTVAAALAESGRRDEAEVLFEGLLEEKRGRRVFPQVFLSEKLLPDDIAGLRAWEKRIGKWLVGTDPAWRSMLNSLHARTAFRLHNLGAVEEAGAIWNSAIAACSGGGTSRPFNLALEALEEGRDDWALPVLLPLVEKGIPTPSRFVEICEKLEKAGAEKAPLAEGLRKYLSDFPRKDMALLAVRLLSAAEAREALDAALAENPRDEELIAARAAIGD